MEFRIFWLLCLLAAPDFSLSDGDFFAKVGYYDVNFQKNEFSAGSTLHTSQGTAFRLFCEVDKATSVGDWKQCQWFWPGNQDGCVMLGSCTQCSNNCPEVMSSYDNGCELTFPGYSPTEHAGKWTCELDRVQQGNNGTDSVTFDVGGIPGGDLSFVEYSVGGTIHVDAEAAVTITCMTEGVLAGTTTLSWTLGGSALEVIPQETENCPPLAGVCEVRSTVTFTAIAEHELKQLTCTEEQTDSFGNIIINGDISAKINIKGIKDKSGLSAGEIVGIVLGIFFLLLIIFLILCFCCGWLCFRDRRKAKDTPVLFMPPHQTTVSSQKNTTTDISHLTMTGPPPYASTVRERNVNLAYVSNVEEVNTQYLANENYSAVAHNRQMDEARQSSSAFGSELLVDPVQYVVERAFQAP